MSHDKFLATLREEAWWQQFEKNELLDVPTVPMWTAGNDPLEWPHLSGVRKGYMLCLAKLGIEPEQL